jgi:hypothetical protein
MFFVFFSVSAVHAGEGGQRPAAYLQLGTGGMQQSMGGAAVGSRNDVSAAFWNPAGLSGIRGFQFEYQHGLLSLGRSLSYLSLASSYQGKVYYGVSGVYYSAGGDLEARSGPSLEPDRIFGDTELAFLAMAAVPLDPRWTLGVNLKVLLQDFDSFSGLGFGQDLGIQYRVTKHTTLGFAVQDVHTFIGFSNSTLEIVPATLKAGLAHREVEWSAKIHADAEWSEDLGLRPRLGVEWRPFDLLALRAGGRLDNLTAAPEGEGLSAHLTAGLGVFIPMDGGLLEFSYSILPDRVQEGAALHQIALKGKFL